MEPAVREAVTQCPPRSGALSHEEARRSSRFRLSSIAAERVQWKWRELAERTTPVTHHHARRASASQGSLAPARLLRRCGSSLRLLLRPCGVWGDLDPGASDLCCRALVGGAPFFPPDQVPPPPIGSRGPPNQTGPDDADCTLLLARCYCA